MKALEQIELIDYAEMRQNESCLFSMQIDSDILRGPGSSCQWLKHLKLINVSRLWEKITGISVIEAKKNFMLLLMKIDPDDMMDIYPMMYKSLSECTKFETDVCYHYPNGRMQRLMISIQPKHIGSRIVCEGTIQTLK